MKRRASRVARYARRSFFVDPDALERARRALGAPTSAEAVRLAIARVLETEKFRRFMDESRGSLKRGSFEAP